MKKLFLTLYSSFFILPSAFCGELYFHLELMTGSVGEEKTINVRAVNNPVIYNNTHYYLPRNGTNFTTVNGFATNSFVPGIYEVSVAGLPKTWKIYVTNNTEIVNAVDLSREIVRYSGVQSVAGNGVTSDGLGNVTVTIPVRGVAAGDNITIATNGAVVTISSTGGGGSGETNELASVGAQTSLVAGKSGPTNLVKSIWVSGGMLELNSTGTNVNIDLPESNVRNSMLELGAIFNNRSNLTTLYGGLDVADGFLTVNNAAVFNGNITSSGLFIGNGSLLTLLNAGQLTSGTIPDARIGSWIARGTNVVERTDGGSTNQYLANPTLTNATFQGPANFASVYATNMAGNGIQVTNVAITNVVSGNADNNFRAGGNATIFGAGNNNNVSLGGSGGEINNSIYSLLAVPNLGGATIENCQTCAIITANEATIFNSQQSVIVGGQHIGIGGAGGGMDGHNAIIGGNNIYIGDQFSSDVFFANSAAGGEFIYHFDGTSRSGSVGGERLYFYAVTNGFAVGSSNRLSGYGPMAIGSLLTNSQNHEVMLGRYGSEVRIKTNGVTSLRKIEFEGGASSGNITNTSSWQIGLAGSAVSTLYTNGSRRGTIYFTGQSGEFGAMVATSLVTYNQGGSNTNEWGKTTIYDTGDIPGYISVSGPVNPNQVYYINPYGTTLTTESFRIVYE
jgi:hypothetical protein